MKYLRYLLIRFSFFFVLPSSLPNSSKIFGYYVRLIPVILIISIFSGCNYFMVTSSIYPKSEDIDPYLNLNKTFVIHTDSAVSVVDEIKIKNEVHFWISSYQSAEEQGIKISLKDIYRFDVYSHNRKMSGRYVFIGALGPPVIFILAVLIGQ